MFLEESSTAVQFGWEKNYRTPEASQFNYHSLNEVTALFIARNEGPKGENTRYLKCTNLTVSLLSGMFHPRTAFLLVTDAQALTSTASLKVTKCKCRQPVFKLTMCT